MSRITLSPWSVIILVTTVPVAIYTLSKLFDENSPLAHAKTWNDDFSESGAATTGPQHGPGPKVSAGPEIEPGKSKSKLHRKKPDASWKSRNYDDDRGRIPWDKLGPKFWVALCSTSAILSFFIFFFELWYFKNFGVSFIEQLALQYLAPLINCGQPIHPGYHTHQIYDGKEGPHNHRAHNHIPNSTHEKSDPNHQPNGQALLPTPSQVNHIPVKYRTGYTRYTTHRNYMRLLRGAEYRRYRAIMNVDPITNFSRKQTNRDWQEMFSCELDKERRCDEIMSRAWLMDTEEKISMAKRALEVSRETFEQSVSDMNDRATKIGYRSKFLNGSSGKSFAASMASPHRPNTLSLSANGTLCGVGGNSNSIETVSDRESNTSSELADSSVNGLGGQLKSMRPNYITPEYDCALACMLIAEEEAETVPESEMWFRRALLSAEYQKEKSSETRHKSIEHENRYHRDYKLVCHIKSRLALCCRRLGKLRESLKLYREITRDYHANSMSIDILYDSMLEVFLEQQSYADVHSLIQRYEGTTHQSTTVVYTSALMKVRAVCGSNMFDPTSLINTKRLSEAERQAIDAVHGAVEYNPHVPLYLLEQKGLILPGEHILRRGDSDAIAYSFWHIRHWKRIPGALTFLEYTWQGAFKNLPHHIDRGYKYVAYPAHNAEEDRKILPTQIHKVSVYPKKYEWAVFAGLVDYPFFIILALMLGLGSATLAISFNYFPHGTMKFWAGSWAALKQPISYLVSQWLKLVQLNINILNKILRIDCYGPT